MNFVHLHVHSHFSLLDGCIHQKDLVRRAADLDMPALALTDHGALFGTVEFYETAVHAGIKPIIGIEAYVAEGSRIERPSVDRPSRIYHLTLLARNEEGYRNLIQLSSQAYLDGFYRKPRMDEALLAEHGTGLIVLSGCMGGAIPQKIAAGEKSAARKLAGRYREIFGPENFYLEIMRNGLDGQEEVNEALIGLSRELDIPLVATNDVHYLEREDSLVHEVVVCINTGRTLRDQNRMKMETDQFYFRSAEEMSALFPDRPEALENTLAIAERCDLKLDFNEYHLPEFKLESGQDAQSYLRECCYGGARKRFGEIAPEIEERLETELEVINSMGFPSYFLIVWDFIKFAKDHNIPVGPGRGSAAGSLVAYCLGITNVNPLKYDLIFERFLNSSRISMPDIDIDFCRDGRDKVIRYVQEKYGATNVCQIITFGTMAARAAIRDAGRVLGIDLQTVDRIAKKIPMMPGTKLKDVLESDRELKKQYESDPVSMELFDISLKIEGLNRHASTHAAGVVITDQPLTEYVPLCRVQNEVNTQYQMTALERIGLLKMDFLGLKNLTILNKAVELIRETRGEELVLAEMPLDDVATFSLLQEGRSLGIFQLESDGMSNLLVRLKPDTFEDIIALLALYRPGPLNSGMVETYVKRKHGLEPVDCLHPSLKELLRETYGVIVYQEQVMRIANILAGFSMNDADALRKAMGKKKKDVMARFRDLFVDGAASRGVEREMAADIYDKIEFFAGYGFNKSHSTAYGIITYQTAYLKANYPLQYMAAIMTCDAANSDKLADYLQECQRMGIKVLGPNINESDRDFTLSKKSIRFGLSAIKGMGDKAIESILASRKRIGSFRTVHQMLCEVDLRAVNKAALEALVKAGAFDSMDVARAAVQDVLDGLVKWAAGMQADRRAGQKGLFGTREEGGEMLRIPEKPEWEENTKLFNEKEALGFFISSDPLQKFARLLKDLAPLTAEEAMNLHDGALVSLCGMVTSLKAHLPKSGRNAGKKMALFRIRTVSGNLSGVAFSREYEKYGEDLQDDRFLVFTGTMDRNREGTNPSLRVSEVTSVDAYLKTHATLVLLRLGAPEDMDEGQLEKIKGAAKCFPGPADLIFSFESPGRKVLSVKAGSRYRVEVREEMILALEEIVGPANMEIR